MTQDFIARLLRIRADYEFRMEDYVRASKIGGGGGVQDMYKAVAAERKLDVAALDAAIEALGGETSA